MPTLSRYEFRLRPEGEFLLTGPGCGAGIVCADALSSYDYWLRYLAPKDATLVIGEYQGIFSGPRPRRQDEMVQAPPVRPEPAASTVGWLADGPCVQDPLSFEVRFRNGGFLLTGPSCGEGMSFGTAQDAWNYWRREFAAGGESLRLVYDTHDVFYAPHHGGPGG